MKRYLHRNFINTTRHENRGEMRRCVSLGDQIKISKENGIAFDGVTQSVFDDADFDGIDPLADPRTDRFDMIEQAGDAHYQSQIAEANRAAANRVAATDVKPNVTE